MKWLLLALVKCYQYIISPWLPQACRYMPTCSVFAAEALQRNGALKGSMLALRRLLRCHPWGGWGYDPVPDSPAAIVKKEQC